MKKMFVNFYSKLNPLLIVSFCFVLQEPYFMRKQIMYIQMEKTNIYTIIHGNRETCLLYNICRRIRMNVSFIIKKNMSML